MTRRSLALSVLSGLLLTASFPSLSYSFLAWFALVPLLLALRGQTVFTGLWLGGICGLVFFCGTVSWVTHALHVYGQVPLPPAALITLLLCAILSLFLSLFGGAVVHIWENRPRYLFLAAPALWVTLEYARTHLFSGFPWALLGYSQYRTLPVIQIADLTGVYGISFLIVLVNAGLAELFGNRMRYLPPAVAAIMTAVVLGYGLYRLNAPEGPGSIRIAVVQGNIEQDKKWDPFYQSEAIETYKRLTRRALERKPDLVIWPETATPFHFGGIGDDRRHSDALRRFVRATNTPLLFGSPTYEVKQAGGSPLRNSAILLDRSGATGAVYHKMHLVPFGEYVPLKRALFFMEKLTSGDVDFQPGSGQTIMQVPLLRGGAVAVGTVICYEIIFPDLVRRFVRAGATVMTTITNDAWFGRTGAPGQHFSMAVLRVVENRIPIARAANTGISGFIDAKGRILESTDLFTEAYLVRTITPSATKTFYTRYGDIFSWLCVLGSLLAILPLRQEKKPPDQ